MRLGSAIVALALLGALGPAAATTHPVNPGPFAGTVEEGETATHTYRDTPEGMGCAQVVTAYVVTLTYAPATDTLELSAAGQTVTAENGTAVMPVLVGDTCSAFDISVTGLEVEAESTYTVSVAEAGPFAAAVVGSGGS